MEDEELKGIVQRMIDAGESEGNIASVIKAYKPATAEPKKAEQPKKPKAEVGLGSPSISASLDSSLGLQPDIKPEFGGRKPQQTAAPKQEAVVSYGEQLDKTPDRGMAARDRASKLIRKQYQDQGINDYTITPEEIDEKAVKLSEKGKLVNIADAITKMNNTKSAKEQRGYLSHLLEDKLAIGSVGLGKIMASIPESLYGIASIPQNLFAAATGIDVSTSAKKFKDTQGISNPILDYYIDEAADLQKKSEKYDEKYIHKGAYESFANGKILDGFQQLGSGIAESAPISIAMMAGGATLSMGQLAAYGTVGMYEDKMSELDADNPSMNEFERNIKALGLAGAETVFGAVSSGTMGKVYKDILLKEGSQTAGVVFKKGVVEMYETALKKYGGVTGALGEGIEEVATTMTQNVINGRPALEGVEESFLQGAGGGALYGSPINAMNVSNKIKTAYDNRQIDKILEADTNEYTTISDVFAPSVAGGINKDKLRIVEQSGSLDKLTKELDKAVEKGELTEADAEAHKKEFLDTNLALSKTNGIELSGDKRTRAVDLIRKKEVLKAEIKNMDESLAASKKEELAKMDEELASMSKPKVDATTAATTDAVVETPVEVSEGSLQVKETDKEFDDQLRNGTPSEVTDAKKYFESKINYYRDYVKMYKEDLVKDPNNAFAKAKVRLYESAISSLKVPAVKGDVTEATPESYAAAMTEAITSMGETGNRVDFQVDPVTVEDAKQIVAEGGKLFMTKDGKSGAYVKADGYMGGLFKNPNSDLKEVAKVLQQARVEAGGTHFDAYGTKLEDIYIKNGFVPVARVPFDESFAPEGWDAADSPLKGRPDNVYFAYMPNSAAKKGDGVVVDSHEAGIELAKTSTERNGKQNTEFFTGKAKEASSKVPYKPVIEVDQTTPVAKAYQKFSSEGNFTGHISKMIAGFAEKQKQVAEAIVKGGFKRFLDIGTSEGGMIKTVASQNPNMKAVGIDPNSQMKDNFNATPNVPNAEFRQEAWQASWTDEDGTVINEFNPTEKFDVVNEDFAFQFMNNNREQQVQGVKAAMTPDGIFVTSEKFDTDNQAANEKKKYDHQKNYFDESQLTEDKQTIVNGMASDMVKDTEYFEVLKKNFKHVEEFWNAGNFKGYIASDNKAVLDEFKNNVGDLSSEFTDSKSKTATNEQNQQTAKQGTETGGTGQTKTGANTSKSGNATGTTKSGQTLSQKVKRVFGLNTEQTKASVKVMDKVIETMAKRAGITVAEMESRIAFKKGTKNTLDKLTKAGNALFQIVGSNAKLSKNVKGFLSDAKVMESKGVSPKEIFLQTGWEKGADNKWKYDLQEGTVEFKSTENGLMSDVLDYEELYKAYPAARKIRVMFKNDMELSGFYSPKSNTIAINTSEGMDEARLTMLHEIQHWVQTQEGFVNGGNEVTVKKYLNDQINSVENNQVKKAIAKFKDLISKGSVNSDVLNKQLLDLKGKLNKDDFELYESIAGEVEARNVESRFSMPITERRTTPIESTEDVSRDEQIVLFQGEQGAMVEQDGQFIVYALTDANVSTPLHELAHVYEHYLTEAEKKVILDSAKHTEWTRETSEHFARGFEKYLSDGIAPTPDLKVVFESFKNWLTGIYNGVTGSEIDITLTEGAIEVFNTMLGLEGAPVIVTNSAAKDLAAKIRGLKINKTLADATKNLNSAPQAIVTLAWDGTMEVVATTIELTGDLAFALEAGLSHLKASKWYQGLSEKGQKLAERKYKDTFRDEIQEVESVQKKRGFWDKLNQTTGQKFVDVFTNVNRAMKELKGFDQLYKREGLFESRAANEVDKMLDKVKDAVKKITKSGYSVKQVSDFMYAKHALERNSYISENVDTENPFGSGMLDIQAIKILEQYNDSETKAMEALAKDFYSIIDDTRTRMVKSGLMSQEAMDAMVGSSNSYVPLTGFADEQIELGQSVQSNKVNVKGREFKKMSGRSTEANNIISNIIKQATDIAVRASKNEVLLEFENISKNNPDSLVPMEIFTQDNLPTGKTVNKDGKVIYSKDKAQMDDSYVGFKSNGEQKYIKFENPVLAQNLNRATDAVVDGFTRYGGKLNRFLSASFTQYNPSFMIPNFFRDLQTALINLKAQADINPDLKGQDLSGAALKNLRSAISTIHANERGSDKKGKLYDYYQEFKEQGAKTGWANRMNLKEINHHVENISDMFYLQEGASTSKKAKVAVRKGWDSFSTVVDNANTSIENGIRLSTYAAARDAGMNQLDAAALAKELTINFNRKGEVGGLMNTLYLFFNASVQGTSTFKKNMLKFKTYTNSKGEIKKTLNRGQKAAIAIQLASFALTLFNMGVSGEDDESEMSFYEGIPDYEKERNIIIMSPDGSGKYLKIPMPYGYNIFANMGTMLAETTMGSRKVGDAAGFLLGSMVGSFAPLSTPEGDIGRKIGYAALPTVATPWVMLGQNKDNFNNDIFRENFPMGDDKLAGSSLGSKNTPDLYKKSAVLLNMAAGGNQYQESALDFHPDKAEFIVDYFGGGTLKFLKDTYGVAEKGVQIAGGAEVPLEARRVPLLSKVYGEDTNFPERNVYYDVKEKAKARLNYLEKTPEGRAEKDPDKGWLRRLDANFDESDKKLKELRKVEKKILLRPDSVEKLEKLEELEIKKNTAYSQMVRKYLRIKDNLEGNYE